jgi:hypothetical protein
MAAGDVSHDIVAAPVVPLGEITIPVIASTPHRLMPVPESLRQRIV